MTIDTAEPGLRERKRLATRRAIQHAAISLAEQGLERVTVDEISRIADISPRTFFNYFPSKEAALIGDGPSLPPSDAVEAFVARGADESIFVGIAGLLTQSGETQTEDHELTQTRRRVLKQHPQLFAMRMIYMREFENQVHAVVVRRLVADHDPSVADPTRLNERARLITLVAFAAMRHAWACWADRGESTDLNERLRLSFEELEALFA